MNSRNRILMSCLLLGLGLQSLSLANPFEGGHTVVVKVPETEEYHVKTREIDVPEKALNDDRPQADDVDPEPGPPAERPAPAGLSQKIEDYLKLADDEDYEVRQKAKAGLSALINDRAAGRHTVSLLTKLIHREALTLEQKRTVQRLVRPVESSAVLHQMMNTLHEQPAKDLRQAAQDLAAPAKNAYRMSMVYKTEKDDSSAVGESKTFSHYDSQNYKKKFEELLKNQGYKLVDLSYDSPDSIYRTALVHKGDKTFNVRIQAGFVVKINEVVSGHDGFTPKVETLGQKELGKSWFLINKDAGNSVRLGTMVYRPDPSSSPGSHRDHSFLGYELPKNRTFLNKVIERSEKTGGVGEFWGWDESTYGFSQVDSRWSFK